MGPGEPAPVPEDGGGGTHGEGSAAAIRSPGTAAAFRRFPWWTAPSGASNRRQRCPASAPLGSSRRRLGRLRRRAGRSRAGSEIAEGGSEPLGNTPPLSPKTPPLRVCARPRQTLGVTPKGVTPVFLPHSCGHRVQPQGTKPPAPPEATLWRCRAGGEEPPFGARWAQRPHPRRFVRPISVKPPLERRFSTPTLGCGARRMGLVCAHLRVRDGSGEMLLRMNGNKLFNL